MKIYIIMRSWHNCGKYEDFDHDTEYVGTATSLADIGFTINDDIRRINNEESNDIVIGKNHRSEFIPFDNLNNTDYVEVKDLPYIDRIETKNKTYVGKLLHGSDRLWSEYELESMYYYYEEEI